MFWSCKDRFIGLVGTGRLATDLGYFGEIVTDYSVLIVYLHNVGSQFHIVCHPFVRVGIFN